MATPQEVKVRRIYEAPQESDGTRILVDRLWPRGLGTEKAHIDGWWPQPLTGFVRWPGRDR